ncbi:hypothetical protein LY007_004202, partial [Salmonella enterica]|nr:hypothetical protein [Salmonella enterica]
SANAKAGAGTVNITFVAGPVDAAQSEVTVPVGAAVQGDPLELHLYARDANRNPVSAAQLDKVNVAIAATGTGVTLTATKTGDDTDATGPYRKYSLVPDTASYATRAIRYNTVTVQVNGTKIGTEYHAAWSPDIDLNRNPEPVYTIGEVADLIQACNTPFIVDATTDAAWTVYTPESRSKTFTERCGTDPETAVSAKLYGQLTPLSASYLKYRVTDPGMDATWSSHGSSIDRSDSAGEHTRTAVVHKDFKVEIATQSSTTGDGKYRIHSKFERIFDYGSVSGGTTGHINLRLAVGFLTDDDRGNTYTGEEETDVGTPINYIAGHMYYFTPTDYEINLTFSMMKSRNNMFGRYNAYDMHVDGTTSPRCGYVTARPSVMSEMSNTPPGLRVLSTPSAADSVWLTTTSPRCDLASAQARILHLYNAIDENKDVYNPHWFKTRI